MKIPPTQRLANEFDERNVVLQLALGGLAMARRLDALLDRWAPASSAPEADDDASADNPAVIDFVLGLIAFRLHFARVVERAAGKRPPRAPETADESSTIAPGELLR